jgi:uncharacterized membrane protein
MANEGRRAGGRQREYIAEGFTRMRSRSLEITFVIVGLVLLGSVLATLIVVTVLDGRMGAAMWSGTGAEMLQGREVGIPISLGGGAPAWLVALVSFTQDTGVVALAYPGFLYLLHKYHDRDNFVMRRLRRIERKAKEHEEFVHRWGPLGIFGFMLVPFLVNGPLFGALMGRMVGIPTRYLILPVLGATAIAAVAWTYFYRGIFSLVDDLHPLVAPILTATIVCALVAWAGISELREIRRSRRDKGSA